MHPWHSLHPWQPPNSLWCPWCLLTPHTPLGPPWYHLYPLLAPQYLQSLPAPWCTPDSPYTPWWPQHPLTTLHPLRAPWCHLYPYCHLSTYTPARPPMHHSHPLTAPQSSWWCQHPLTPPTTPRSPMLPPIPCWPLSSYTPCQPPMHPWHPLRAPWCHLYPYCHLSTYNPARPPMHHSHPLTAPQSSWWCQHPLTPPTTPRSPILPPISMLVPEYLHSLPAPQCTPPPWLPHSFLTTPYTPWWPPAPSDTP